MTQTRALSWQEANQQYLVGALAPIRAALTPGHPKDLRRNSSPRKAALGAAQARARRIGLQRWTRHRPWNICVRHSAFPRSNGLCC